jgi:S1-C subfamily serine protease
LPRGVAITDENGAFTLQGLPSGPATVEAFSALGGRGSARVDVQSNRKQTGVRITLKPNANDQEPFAPGGVAVTLGERGSGDALEVVVVAVAENSEAERAGIQPGDVLAAVDDVKPSSMADARARLGGPLSSDVIVSVSRSGALTKIAVLREAVRR